MRWRRRQLLLSDAEKPGAATITQDVAMPVRSEQFTDVLKLLQELQRCLDIRRFKQAVGDAKIFYEVYIEFHCAPSISFQAWQANCVAREL